VTRPQRTFPPSLLRQFIQTTIAEVGSNELSQVIADASLIDVDRISSINSLEAGEIYAKIQQQLRLYYGRGARGLLLRIGQNLWEPALLAQGLVDRALATGVKVLPAGSRQKRILDLLAKFMRGNEGNASVYTMDLNLLFVDSSSPVTVNPSESQPICFVTQGLIRGALYWATGKNYDVEETSCRVMGSDSCEFKIVGQGK
jgi:predicted hydrocarbon binding protein